MDEAVFLLAAGYGLRMRPLTNHTPKPLVRVNNIALIDRVKGKFDAENFSNFMVNCHHLPEQIKAHFKGNENIRIIDEADLYETGGACVNLLKCHPEAVNMARLWAANADSFWQDDDGQYSSLLARMRAAWDEGKMDALLAICPLEKAHGYSGYGDFIIPNAKDDDKDTAKIISRRPPTTSPPDEQISYVFMGVQILKPRLFQHYSLKKFSLNIIYDELIKANRLAAIIHGGSWFHVGTVADIANSEKLLNQG